MNNQSDDLVPLSPDGEDVNEDLMATYGAIPNADDIGLIEITKRKIDFKPWHHPVKQVVRARQWAALTERLIKENQISGLLRYFTLPGPDLLDVRVIADVCGPLDIKVEYFGFDIGVEPKISGANPGGVSKSGAWITAESALRQSGRITPEAIILPDRLEDIAIEQSQASAQLKQQAPFHVVNIDACDHLAYCPQGRTLSTFDALKALLNHQMIARTPWLLFVTTRVDPALLGIPGTAFQTAINENLKLPVETFGKALADAVGADPLKFGTSLPAIWTKHDASFLKLYSIGLGKFLLQFFHMQVNLPAKVELASCYAYRVYTDEPDMLALAFRIIPEGTQSIAPGIGGAAAVATLEASRAKNIAERAQKLQDLDSALQAEAALLKEAVNGTKALLSAANYDVEAWTEWLRNHDRRPIQVAAE